MTTKPLAFPDTFGTSAYVGETLTLEHKGFRITATIEADDDMTPPWEREDGHGPVSRHMRHAFGQGTKPPKRPGEMILYWDHGTYRTYDFAEACRIALADGWDAKPYNRDGRETKRQQAAKAALADFKRLQGWCENRWYYVGVALQVTHIKSGVDLTGPYAAALWGIESDAGEYLTETANELLTEALEEAKRALATLRAKVAA